MGKFLILLRIKEKGLGDGGAGMIFGINMAQQLNHDGSFKNQNMDIDKQVDVVKSDKTGLFQHDVFNWHIDRDHFIRVNDFNDECKKIKPFISHGGYNHQAFKQNYKPSPIL